MPGPSRNYEHRGPSTLYHGEVRHIVSLVKVSEFAPPVLHAYPRPTHATPGTPCPAAGRSTGAKATPIAPKRARATCSASGARNRLVTADEPTDLRRGGVERVTRR